MRPAHIRSQKRLDKEACVLAELAGGHVHPALRAGTGDSLAINDNVVNLRCSMIVIMGRIRLESLCTAKIPDKAWI
jgi:hypothetical protein